MEIQEYLLQLDCWIIPYVGVTVTFKFVWTYVCTHVVCYTEHRSHTALVTMSCSDQ